MDALVATKKFGFVSWQFVHITDLGQNGLHAVHHVVVGQQNVHANALKMNHYPVPFCQLRKNLHLETLNRLDQNPSKKKIVKGQLWKKWKILRTRRKMKTKKPTVVKQDPKQNPDLPTKSRKIKVGFICEAY